MNPHIALLGVEIHIPESRSLKSKRTVLKSLKDRIRARFNVSVAEIEGRDTWQRVVFGICMIGTDKAHLDRSLQAVLSLIESVGELRILRHRLEFL